MYLTREQSIEALTNMRLFNDELRNLFSSFDMNLEANLGRRNILLSSAQERFFADAMRGKFPDVRSDGHTGEPDIIIPELDNKELECKLTTRYQSSGALSFQSDSMSFEGKENGLDFLYVVADERFESFAVLHFIGLTREDFHKESTGARGRVRMKKHRGIPKCNIVVGGVIDLRDARIEQCEQEITTLVQKRDLRLNELNERVRKSTPGTKAKEKAIALLKRENDRYIKRVEKAQARLLNWQTKNPMYSITLENVGDKTCQTLTCVA
jgi:hypothetical protein